MKRVLLTLAMTMVMLSVASGEDLDSLVMNRVFNFQRDYTQDINGFSTNVYLKHIYQTHRRNATLWAIPHMYTIANGERAFVCEQYNRFHFRTIDDYDNIQQVYNTTIPRQRHTMPVLMTYVMPNLYGTTLYGNHILSPFCRENRIFYHYSTVPLSNNQARIYFRPKIVPNTQLVEGKAIVNSHTGQIEQTEIEGEYDMIHFQTITMQGEEGLHALLPQYCLTDIAFKFAGNHITSHFEAVFDCPITLADTVDVTGDYKLMDSIRPISLSQQELCIYDDFINKHTPVTEEDSIIEEAIDSLSITATLVGKKKLDEEGDDQDEEYKPHHNYLKESWDLIEDNLFRSISSKSKNSYIRLSPILDPQYVSYSRSKGLSYKMNLYAIYKYSDKSWIDFHPHIGYNFKLQEFYIDAPIQFVYNSKYNAGIDACFSKDNRIGNASVLEDIKKEYGEDVNLEGKDLDLFDDYSWNLSHHISPVSWLNIRSGFVLHKRVALNPQAMSQYGKFSKYYSLAPSIIVRLNPWQNAPFFTINYERGFKIKNNYLRYERIEADASFKYKMKRTEQINTRIGGGFYTDKRNNYFLDFANFRANNLPDGWDDDWSGDFQLLSSRLYNESSYYIRGHLSYEAPLLGAFLTPAIGRYVERERVYLSTLSIDHTRQYSEIGYGFSCRMCSMGIFASFLNTEYQKIGCKFTFELFRRW